MKTLVALLLLGLVVAGFAHEEEDVSHNFDEEIPENARIKRWLFKDKCKVDSDCKPNHCCEKSWFRKKCHRMRHLHQLCSTSPRASCYHACAEGLECRTFSANWPIPRHQRCVIKPTQAPTTEPGSGDFE
ncbi:uncharacterized protein LOC5512887 [Nematostella vectensis]|uniref:uncharacterized protein LOC5512887 n=1 Tax=Nematostella vectensis TaxID=45351 RepID=UPI002076FFAA|nr:uncharacterized protein LOC5512887 [Nematostella vectensis]